MPAELTTPETPLMRADRMAAGWLADGNAASEKGQSQRAEKCYAKSQYWHDRSNRLRGNGDGNASELTTPQAALRTLRVQVERRKVAVADREFCLRCP